MAPLGPLGESDVELSSWKGEFTWGKEELGHTGKGNLNADIKDFYFCRSPGNSLHFFFKIGDSQNYLYPCQKYRIFKKVECDRGDAKIPIFAGMLFDGYYIFGLRNTSLILLRYYPAKRTNTSIGPVRRAGVSIRCIGFYFPPGSI